MKSSLLALIATGLLTACSAWMPQSTLPTETLLPQTQRPTECLTPCPTLPHFAPHQLQGPPPPDTPAVSLEEHIAIATVFHIIDLAGECRRLHNTCRSAQE